MAAIIERQYTPEDLLKITDRPMPELVDGQLVEREPMGQEADEVGTNFIALLSAYAKSTSPAVVNGSQGGYQIFPDDPDKVRFPDVSFTRRDRIPGGRAARGHSRVVPDLVVEVISPNDNASDVRVKVRDYLAAGVPLIWVANPDTRDVEAIRGDGSASLLRLGDVLDGGDVLPGFSCTVDEVFEGLD